MVHLQSRKRLVSALLLTTFAVQLQVSGAWNVLQTLPAFHAAIGIDKADAQVTGGFSNVAAAPKYYYTWLASITCRNGSGNLQTFGSEPFSLRQLVATTMDSKGISNPPQNPIVRTTNGSQGAGFGVWNDGTFDITGLTAVCQILGNDTYTYVSSTCPDSERSALYGGGKCNFHSPEDNQLSRFTGGVASSVACSDGVDNDGDGLIDFGMDPGCTSQNDNDEFNAGGGVCTLSQRYAARIASTSGSASGGNPPTNGVQNIIGAPDGQLVQFDGTPGYVTIEFTNGYKATNGPGADILVHLKDFRIIENERFEVLASEDGSNFVSLGSRSPSTHIENVDETMAFDLAGTGLNAVRFVTVRNARFDVTHGSEGPDLDAIGMSPDSCSPVQLPPQCSDGQDNDGDGFIDFGMDPGCSSATDNDESNNNNPNPGTCTPQTGTLVTTVSLNSNVDTISTGDYPVGFPQEEAATNNPKIVTVPAGPAIVVYKSGAWNPWGQLGNQPARPWTTFGRVDDGSGPRAIGEGNFYSTSTAASSAAVGATTGITSNGSIKMYIADSVLRNTGTVTFDVYSCNPPVCPAGRTTASFEGRQGPWEDVAPNGDATPPTLVGGVQPGSTVRVISANGSYSARLYGGNDELPLSCDQGTLSFTNNANQTILKVRLFNATNGVTVPNGATRAYVSHDEPGSFNYFDNSGNRDHRSPCVVTFDITPNSCQLPQCRDGIDNDGDDLVDFPNDPGCSNPDDNDEGPRNIGNLDVEKTLQGQITPGQDATYLITVRNTGNFAAQNVNVYDYFLDDQDLKYVPFTFISSTGVTCTYQSGLQQVACPVGTIAPGTTVSMTLRFNVPTNQTCNMQVRNRVDAWINGQQAGADTDDVSSGVQCLAQCQNGRDDDGDGLVDFPNDPGCVNAQDNDEFNQAPRNLVGYWTFNNVFGNTVPDSSSFNNDGTIQSSGVRPINGCMQFDGASRSDFIRVPDSASLDLPNAVTIAAWVYQIESRNAYILSKNPGDNPPGNYGVHIVNTPHPQTQWNNVRFAAQSAPQYDFVDSTTKLPIGSWKHVTVTVDRTAGEARFYINGALDSVRPWTAPLPINSEPLTIGFGQAGTSYSQPFHGYLDEVRLYNYALSASEVSSIVGSEPTCIVQAQCRNGRDDDGDGLVDMNDPGCSTPDDNNESDEPACSDRRDNDGDGLVDFPADPGCVSPSDTDEFNAPQTADLSIQKSGPASVVRGQTILYTITVANAGPAIATNVVVTDQIPAGLVYNDAQSFSSCSQQGNTVVCTRPSLNANQSGTFTIAFDTPAQQNCQVVSVVNSINVRSDQQDTVQGNNNASTQLNPTRVDCPNVPQCQNGRDDDGDGLVDMNDPGCSTPDDNNEADEPQCSDRRDNDGDGLIDFPFDPGCVNAADNDEFNQAQTVDLSVNKSGPPAIVRGQTIFYTIQFGNSGTAQATNVVITDPIPAGLFYNDGQSYSQCSQVGNNVVCTIPTVNSQSFSSITIAFDTQAQQNCQVVSVVNTVSISSSQQDTNQGNNNASTQLNPTRVDCPNVPQCQNGRDDDGDGLVDMNDPGCSTPDDNNEGDEPACSDRRDNDGDGLVDFPADPGCVSPGDTDEFNAPLPQCSNGRDDDGDGFVDMNDPGCSSPNDNNESDDPACSDHRDNDFDGLTDFPMDPGCVSPADTDEFNAPLTQCSDGLDNDNDGRVDMQDPGCTSPQDNNESDEPQCSDRRDNDGDGLTDWPADPGCQTPADNDEFNAPLPQCSNGRDDDGDGLVDMQDPGCTNPQDDNEGDEPACSDRRDNDGDNLIDWPLDPGCSSPQDNDETNALPQCSDGLDNDFDGKTDMQDPGCSNPQDNNESDDPVLFGCIEIMKETFDPHGSPLPIAAQFTFILDATRVAYNDAAGHARFTNVLAGQHSVAEIIPSGWSQLSINPPNGVVNVTAGTNCAQVAFRNRQVFVANAQCSDGYDNDGDGLTDYPQDTGCSSATDNDEYNNTFVPQCRDGLDNDGDGLRDFPQDPGCANADDNNEQNQTTTVACNDGVDNDGDNLVDYPSDPGCASATDIDEYNGGGNPQHLACVNNACVIVNGAGTNTCAVSADCTTVTVACNDNADNDGDGLKDYPQDPGCSSATDTDEFNFRAPRCSDGLDNDNDGKVDYPLDPGCTTSYDDNEYDSRTAIDRWREWWNWNW